MNTVSTHFRPFAAPPRASFAPPAPRDVNSEAAPRPVSSRPATTVGEIGRHSGRVSDLDSTFSRLAAGFRSIVSNVPRPDADTPARADTQVGPDKSSIKPEVTRADTQVAPDKPSIMPEVTRADTQVAPDRTAANADALGTFGRRASQVAPDRPTGSLGGDTPVVRESELVSTPDFTRADTRPVQAYTLGGAPSTTAAPESRIFDRVA